MRAAWSLSTPVSHDRRSRLFERPPAGGSSNRPVFDNIRPKRIYPPKRRTKGEAGFQSRTIYRISYIVDLRFKGTVSDTSEQGSLYRLKPFAYAVSNGRRRSMPVEIAIAASLAAFRGILSSTRLNGRWSE